MKESLMQIRRHELLEEIELLVIALCKNYNLGQDICVSRLASALPTVYPKNMPGKLYAFLKITDIRLPSATWIFITVLTVEIGANLGVVII